MSWSFRKDCVGFARSLILDSSEDSKRMKKGVVVQGRYQNDEESLNYLLCLLIAYFVSTVSHDVEEWLTWGEIMFLSGFNNTNAHNLISIAGVPYVDICVGALKLDPNLTVKLRDQFIGTVGRGYLFVFEEEEEKQASAPTGGEHGEHGEDEGWTHVTPLPSFLSSLGDRLAVLESEKGGVQGVLDGFLGALQAAVEGGKYDTRTRVVSEGGCDSVTVCGSTLFSRNDLNMCSNFDLYYLVYICLSISSLAGASVSCSSCRTKVCRVRMPGPASSVGAVDVAAVAVILVFQSLTLCLRFFREKGKEQ